MTLTTDHWIAGGPRPGTGEPIPVHDPARGTVVAHAARADATLVDETVRIAATAQRAWAATSLARRTEILFRMRELVVAHAEDMARLISREHGKTVPDALGEIGRGRETLDFVCGIAGLAKGEFTADASTGLDVHSLRQPIGVVAGITPFNFPAMVPFWMHPVAIATGNAFILKPSERDPSVSNLVAELYRDAGLPDGVFQVLHGDRVVVDALLDHPGIAGVSFVGSTPVARHVHARATETGKRVQALGGANNHAVVMPDADVSFAADQLVAAAFGSAGERCMAVPVAVAVGGAGEALVAELATRARDLVVGPGDDERTDLGPVISPEARDRIRGLVDDAVAEGADAVVDGRDVKVEDHPDGYFLGPTVLDAVTASMSVYREEVFGPVLTVLRVDTLDEAIALVNDSPYGNGSAIFTASGEAARRYSHEVEAGMVGVNVPIPVPVAYYSFGGWKDSLFGEHHAHGPEAIRFYTRAKVVTTRWPHQEGAAAAASLSFPSTTH